MGRVLHLFAGAGAARDFLAGQIAEGEAVSAEGAQSFQAFAMGLALQSGRALRPPSPAVRAALAHAAARLGGLPLRAGSSSAFAAVLSQLHASRIEPPMIARAGYTAGMAERSAQLAAALAAHERLLRERSLLDPGLVAVAAREALDRGLRPPFDEIFVARRIGWSQAELELCAALSRVTPGGFHLELAFDAERPELFAPLEGIHQELYRLGVAVTNSDLTERAASALRPALSALFKSGAVAPSGDAVAVFTAPTAESEAREVALRVREVLRGGVAPDRIAVAARQGVGRALVRALRSAGIPIAPGRGTRSLGLTAPGRAARSILALVRDGIRREPLCALLSSGIFPLGGRPGDRFQGARLARDLRAAGSGDHRSGTLVPPLRRWLEQRHARFGGQTPALASPGRKGVQLGLFEPAVKAGGPEPSPEKSPLEPLEDLLGRLSELPDAETVAGHARALWKVLRLVGAVGVLESAAARVLDTPNPLALEVAEANLSLERLAELLGELVALEAAGSPLPELDRAEFEGLLRDLMAREPAPGPIGAGGGVLLASFQDLIGREVDHLFLVQLSQDETRFAAVHEELFLPAKLRRELRRMLERPALFAGAGRQEKLAEEALLFTLATCTARHSLTASAPRTEAKGRSIDAAPILAELESAAGVRRMTIGGGPIPAGRRCLTRREVVAAHLDSPLVQRAEPERSAVLSRVRQEANERDAAIAAGRPHPLSGALSPPVAAMLREVLAFPPSSPATPTLISLLGTCGFRALWERVLRVEPPVERSEELDVREQGSLRHICLEEVYGLLMARELVPLRGGERRDLELKTVLDGIEIGLERFARDQPIGHAVVFAAQERKLRREILALYQADVDQGGTYTPVAFELGFKAGETEPVLLEGLPDGPAWLGGRIDRVDTGGPDKIRLVDYKRGRLEDHQAQLREGLTTSALQLPIYAALATARLGLGRKVDAVYASIGKANFATKGVRAICEEQGIDPDAFLSSDPEVRARCRAEETPNVLERATELLAAARSGTLAVQPGDCRTCRLAAACRVGPRYLEWEG